MGVGKLVVVLLASVTCLMLVAVTRCQESQFVCYDDPLCAENVSRPIFTEGESIEGCCGMPHVTSVLKHSTEECTECGPPTVVRVSPRHIALTPPETLVLEVAATGYERITWLYGGLNGGEVLGLDPARLELEDYSKRLLLSDTSTADYGVYEVDVHTIGGGIVTVDFIVGSFVSPAVLLVLEGTLTSEQLLNLTCTASGNPVPSVAWVFNDIILTSRETYITYGDTDTLPNNTAIVELNTEGSTAVEEYICIATTMYNDTTFSDQDSLYLRATLPLVYIRVPRDDQISADVLTFVSFTCLSSGDPDPTVHWEKNGELVENSERIDINPDTYAPLASILNIPAAQATDTGDYRCIASNPAGEDSELFQLKVSAPPNVTAWPDEVVVNVHESSRNVYYMCRATGYPLPNVTWVTEDMVLTGYCEVPAMGQDQFDYNSTDYDSTGQDTLGEAPLGEAPTDTTQNTTNMTDGLALLPSDCSITTVTVDCCTVMTMLTIVSATMETSTNFTCLGVNGEVNNVGLPEKDIVSLLVVATPFFLAHPSPTVRTKLSYFVGLNCTVIGQTAPNVTWYKNGEPILTDQANTTSRISIYENVINTTVESILAVSLVEKEDEGVYTCQASNEDGVNSTSTTLNVRVPSNVTVPPLDVVVSPSGTAVFTCDAFGSPLPTIFWARINNQGDVEYLSDFGPETSDNNSTSTVRITVLGSNATAGTVSSQLEIENVQESDEGQYACITFNGILISNLTTIRENASATLEIQIMCKDLNCSCGAPPCSGPELYCSCNASCVILGSCCPDYTDVCTTVSPLIVDVSDNTTVTVNSSDPTNLTCSAIGLPTPEIAWFHEGRELISSGERISIVASTEEVAMGQYLVSSRLRIDGTQLTDAGQYSCVAGSSVRNSSARFQLTVLASPVVTTEGQTNRTVVLPVNTTFIECTVVGYPLPTVLWFKSGQPLEVTERVTIETTVLPNSVGISSVVRLDNTQPSDAGLYVCVAENTLGSDELEFLLTVESADVVIGFIPTLYAVNESAGAVQVGIGLISGSLQGFSIDINISAFDNTAKAGSDFNFASQVLTFTSSNTLFLVNVEIIADVFAEQEEYFFLNAVLTDPFFSGHVMTSPDRADIRILDDDFVVIGFELVEYQVTEGANPGGDVVLNIGVLQGTIDQGETVLVNFTTEDGTARGDGSDYETTNVQLGFINAQSQEARVVISDDAQLELDEDFFVNLVLVSTALDVTLSPDRARVILSDEDNVTIGFNPSNYNASEDGGSVTLTIQLISGELGRSVELILSTRDGTAEANLDYAGVLDRSIVLNSTSTFSDIVVSIANDSTLEAMEQFVASLVIVSTDTRGVILDPLEATVNIQDNDGAMIGFALGAYTVQESAGFVTVTVLLIEGLLGRNIVVTLQTSNGTAISTGPEADYSASTIDLTFNETVTAHTINITITDDGFLEYDETLQSTVSLVTSEDGVTLNPDATTITILDDDSVVIGFEEPLYRVELGESNSTLMIGVVIFQGQLRRDVQVRVYTESGTALDGDDYIGGDHTLIFSQEVSRIDLNITLVGDQVLEPVEQFIGHLESPDGDLVLNPNRTLIQLVDTGNILFTFRQPTYQLFENISMGEVCIDKIGDSSQTLSVMVNGALQANSSGVIDQVLAYSPNQTEKCISFPVVDNQVALEEAEILVFSLTLVDSMPGVQLGLFNSVSVTIIDDDELDISLELNDTFAESVGSAEACVIFNLAFATGFQIEAQFGGNVTTDAIATPEVDYESSNRSIFASPSFTSGSRICFTFTIIDDALVEERLESFRLAISLTESAPEMIQISVVSQQSQIEDDDTILIGFVPDSISTLESSEEISFVVTVISGTLGRPVEVDFMTADRTTRADADYQNPGRTLLQFDSITNTHLVHINIIDDIILEENETFIGQLTTNDSAVNFDPAQAVATIIEDSDNIVIGFQPTEYSVFEFEDTVTLTVGLISGQLERNVSIDFRTTPGTATPNADYQTRLAQLEFTPTQASIDIAITIMDDSTIEGDETFLGRLENSLEEPVVLAPNIASVIIIDANDTNARVEVTTDDTDGVINEGELISLMCAAYSDPTPVITWLKDNSPVELEFAGNTRVSVTEELADDNHVMSTLTIESALPSNEGEYKCRIDNHNIDDQPAVAAIEITVLPKDECILSEDPLVTPCENNATCIDEVGGYGCECTSDFTGVNCTEETIIRKPPTIVSEPEDVESMLFQPISLNCEAVGEPDPTYSWYRDGLFLFNTSKQELIIAEARPQDRGEYTCVAHNVHGSSNASTPALVTVSGVFQYIANFSDCSGAAAGNFMELISLFSDCVSGRILQTTMSTLYSISPRLVRTSPFPEEQIILTVVANGSSTEGIMGDLQLELDRLAGKFQCQFRNLQRYDGCPMEDYILNQDYGVLVTWTESEIGVIESLVCPCGTITGSVDNLGQLQRVCRGTYTYGAFWDRALSECNFNNNTFQLCSVTTLSEEEQAAALGEATEEASTYAPLDFTIATVIMQRLTETTTIETDVLFQREFTRSFDNLLETSAETVAESQKQSQSSSSLLESLDQFAGRILLGVDNTFNFTEENFQIVIEDYPFDEFPGLTYAPTSNQLVQDFQRNATQTPVQHVSITLPDDLESSLLTMDQRSTLRVSTLAVFRTTLFTLNETSSQAVQLARGDRTFGNIVICASLPGFEMVNGESVIIHYTLTKGLNETSVIEAECVFWELPENFVYGNWSDIGCRLVGIDQGVVTCECTHLTHFGLLLDISPAPHEEEGVDVSLQVITYLGIILSILCLIIVLFTYCCSRKLRSRPVGKLLIHMCTALTALYVSFLLAMHGEQYDSAVGFCYFCSFLLQYFLLVFLFWTSIEAFHIYLQLVKVFGSDIPRFVLKASLVAWGLPALITIISLVVGIVVDQYVARVDGDLFFCRPVKWPFYFGIILPFVLVYFFNIAVFFIVVYSLLKTTHQRQKLSETRQKLSTEYKKLAVIVFILSVLFGLGWTFAFLIPTDLHSDGVIISTVAQYIFSILVGFHGVLIFLLYCLRSQEVRQEWSRWFTKYVCCFEPPQAPHTLTRSTVGRPKRIIESNSGDSYFLRSGNKHNPMYESQENGFLEATGSTFVQPVAEMDVSAVGSALDNTMDALSYASETLLLDFSTVKGQSDEDSDDEDGFTILQELNAKFFPSPEKLEFVTTAFDSPSQDITPEGVAYTTDTVESRIPRERPFVEITSGDTEELGNGPRDIKPHDAVAEYKLTVM